MSYQSRTPFSSVFLIASVYEINVPYNGALPAIDGVYGDGVRQTEGRHLAPLPTAAPRPILALPPAMPLRSTKLLRLLPRKQIKLLFRTDSECASCACGHSTQCLSCVRRATSSSCRPSPLSLRYVTTHKIRFFTSCPLT